MIFVTGTYILACVITCHHSHNNQMLLHDAHNYIITRPVTFMLLLVMK